MKPFKGGELLFFFCRSVVDGKLILGLGFCNHSLIGWGWPTVWGMREDLELELDLRNKTSNPRGQRERERERERERWKPPLQLHVGSQPEMARWRKHACMLSHFSCVQLFVTLWTVAHLAPLSMGFSRQEYWWCHALLQGIFSTQGLDLHLFCLLHWQVGSLPLGPTWEAWKKHMCIC